MKDSKRKIKTLNITPEEQLRNLNMVVPKSYKEENMKETIIKNIQFKLDMTRRDNERRIKQFKAQCELQESYLEEILESAKLIKE